MTKGPDLRCLFFPCLEEMSILEDYLVASDRNPFKTSFTGRRTGGLLLPHAREGEVEREQAGPGAVRFMALSPTFVLTPGRRLHACIPDLPLAPSTIRGSFSQHVPPNEGNSSLPAQGRKSWGSLQIVLPRVM